MNKNIILFDTETTSWDGCIETGWDTTKNQFRELIQIGALLIDCDNLTIKDTFLTFCKPVRNPQLSEYIMNLTGVTQNDVDMADTFPLVYQRFLTWIGTTQIYSYGYDYDILSMNCELSGIQQIIQRAQTTDIKLILRDEGFPISAYHSGTLGDYYNIEPVGHDHDALSDMVNMLGALREMKKRQEFPMTINAVFEQ